MQRHVAADSNELSPPLDLWRHLPPRIRHQKAVQFQQQRILQSELRGGALTSSTAASKDSHTTIATPPSFTGPGGRGSSAVRSAIIALRTFLVGGGDGGGKGNWKSLAVAGVAVLLFAISVLVRRGMSSVEGQQRKLVESALKRGATALGGPSVSQVAGRGPTLARLEI